MMTTPRSGMHVRYIPPHAFGNAQHPDCATGTVSSVNAQYVFVKFDEDIDRHGWHGCTARACYAATLVEQGTATHEEDVSHAR